VKRQGYLLDLPQTAYREAYDLQQRVVAARIAGRLPLDLVIMLEHPPVFTLGRRGGRQNLLVSEAMLAEKGIQIVPIERGGDITYHGPGQLVVYVLINLNAARLKVTELVDGLEEAMVRTAAQWGLKARGDAQMRGAWIAKRKLGSVGITIRRGVSVHGLALNVHTDLTPFSWINPCGLTGCRMTSLALESKSAVPMDQVREGMARHLEELLDIRLATIDLVGLKAHLEP